MRCVFVFVQFHGALLFSREPFRCLMFHFLMSPRQTDHLVVQVGNVAERDTLLSPLIGWQKPDALSIGKAQRIFDEIVFPALDTLTSLVDDGSQAMLKDEIIANVQIVSTAVEGASESLLPEVVEVGSELIDVVYFMRNLNAV